MSHLKNINYLIFGSRKLEQWQRFFTDFLGMPAQLQSDGSLKARMDAQAYRFIVIPDDCEDLWAAGFQLGSRDALRAFEKHLQSQGVEYVRASRNELESRQVEDMIWFRDPQGLRLEVVCGPQELCEPVQLPLVPGGFVTGEQGFGHIAITAEDLELCEHFYKDILGFALSDYIVQNIQGFQIKFTFFHINPRHHTLALAGVPSPQRMHHFMVQVHGMDNVGRARERAIEQEIPIHMEIGRHPNDRMLSFYAMTPSGTNVEFGTDGLEIHDDSQWQVKTYDSISAWGHKL